MCEVLFLCTRRELKDEREKGMKQRKKRVGKVALLRRISKTLKTVQGRNFTSSSRLKGQLSSVACLLLRVFSKT